MKHPEELPGITMKYKNNCGSLYVTINSDAEGNAYEVFLRTGKAGQPCRSFLEIYGKWITDSLRNKRDLSRMAKHCRGITCKGTTGEGKPCQELVADVLDSLCKTT